MAPILQTPVFNYTHVSSATEFNRTILERKVISLSPVWELAETIYLEGHCRAKIMPLFKTPPLPGPARLRGGGVWWGGCGGAPTTVRLSPAGGAARRCPTQAAEEAPAGSGAGSLIFQTPQKGRRLGGAGGWGGRGPAPPAGRQAGPLAEHDGRFTPILTRVAEGGARGRPGPVPFPRRWRRGDAQDGGHRPAPPQVRGTRAADRRRPALPAARAPAQFAQTRAFPAPPHRPPLPAGARPADAAGAGVAGR